MYASVEADRQWVRVVGAENPDRAWISAPSDAWYPNPSYHGPPVQHPEDDYDFEEEVNRCMDEMEARGGPFYRFDLEIPF